MLENEPLDFVSLCTRKLISIFTFSQAGKSSTLPRIVASVINLQILMTSFRRSPFASLNYNTIHSITPCSFLSDGCSDLHHQSLFSAVRTNFSWIENTSSNPATGNSMNTAKENSSRSPVYSKTKTFSKVHVLTQ